MRLLSIMSSDVLHLRKDELVSDISCLFPMGCLWEEVPVKINSLKEGGVLTLEERRGKEAMEMECWRRDSGQDPGQCWNQAHSLPLHQASLSPCCGLNCVP